MIYISPSRKQCSVKNSAYLSIEISVPETHNILFGRVGVHSPFLQPITVILQSYFVLCGSLFRKRGSDFPCIFDVQLTELWNFMFNMKNHSEVK